jgi:hypothetical protein
MNTDTTRTEKLLLSIAADFKRGAQPMNPAWLSENNVELRELEALGSKLDIIIRGWALAPGRVRAAILACALSDDKQSAEYKATVVLKAIEGI